MNTATAPPTKTTMSQAECLQLLLDNPNMSCNDWRAATGLSKRSYFDYRTAARKKGVPTTDADGAPRQTTKRRLVLPVLVPTESEDEVATGQRSKRAPLQTLSTTPEPPADHAGIGLANGRTRLLLLVIVFLVSQGASVHNMFTSFGATSPDLFSVVATTTVFSIAAMAFMFAGVRHRLTIALVISLVAFEAICNAAASFGNLYAEGASRQSPFLQNLTDLLTYVHPKNVAQFISFFYAAIIAAVAYMSAKEMAAVQPRAVAVQRK